MHGSACRKCSKRRIVDASFDFPLRTVDWSAVPFISNRCPD
jgi:hypothetical protein